MIIHTNNIFAGPLILLVWAIDLFLFLCMVRLFLSRISGDMAKRACAGLEGLTDPVPRAVQGWLSVVRKHPVPAWPPWVLTFLALSSSGKSWRGSC